VRMFVCVCGREKDGERARDRENEREEERERKREREGKTERVRERGRERERDCGKGSERVYARFNCTRKISFQGVGRFVGVFKTKFTQRYKQTDQRRLTPPHTHLFSRANAHAHLREGTRTHRHIGDY